LPEADQGAAYAFHMGKDIDRNKREIGGNKSGCIIMD